MEAFRINKKKNQTVILSWFEGILLLRQSTDAEKATFCLYVKLCSKKRKGSKYAYNHILKNLLLCRKVCDIMFLIWYCYTVNSQANLSSSI